MAKEVSVFCFTGSHLVSGGHVSPYILDIISFIVNVLNSINNNEINRDNVQIMELIYNSLKVSTLF